MRFFDLSRGFDAVHVGHLDVHQDDIGLVTAGQIDGLASICCLSDDLDVGLSI